MKTTLKQLRAQKGITQLDLAKAVSVRRETILYLEQGKYNPSLKLAHQIATFFGKPIESVFIFEDE